MQEYEACRLIINLNAQTGILKDVNGMADIRILSYTKINNR
jgi:hypothetical protein